jgi:hypothetical protein
VATKQTNLHHEKKGGSRQQTTLDCRVGGGGAGEISMRNFGAHTSPHWQVANNSLLIAATNMLAMEVAIALALVFVNVRDTTWSKPEYQMGDERYAFFAIVIGCLHYVLSFVRLRNAAYFVLMLVGAYFCVDFDIWLFSCTLFLTLHLLETNFSIIRLLNLCLIVFIVTIDRTLQYLPVISWQWKNVLLLFVLVEMLLLFTIGWNCIGLQCCFTGARCCFKRRRESDDDHDDINDIDTISAVSQSSNLAHAPVSAAAPSEQSSSNISRFSKSPRPAQMSRKNAGISSTNASTSRASPGYHGSELQLFRNVQPGVIQSTEANNRLHEN